MFQPPLPYFGDLWGINLEIFGADADRMPPGSWSRRTDPWPGGRYIAAVRSGSAAGTCRGDLGASTDGGQDLCPQAVHGRRVCSFAVILLGDPSDLNMSKDGVRKLAESLTTDEKKRELAWGLTKVMEVHGSKQHSFDGRSCMPTKTNCVVFSKGVTETARLQKGEWNADGRAVLGRGTAGSEIWMTRGL